MCDGEEGTWRVEGGRQLLCLHSNLEVLDEVCLLLFGSNDDGFVGDVGQGDLVLAAAVLGRLLTHDKDEQLCWGRGGGEEWGGRSGGDVKYVRER